jgi:membrane protein implicated in regulation of membrane protease activity
VRKIIEAVIVFSFLLTWYNLPFLIALGGCILFALLQLIGGIGDNDADADLDANFDTDVDIDADFDLDGAADLPEAQPQYAGQSFGPLAALGLGRIPLALILMALLGCFGAIGLIANTLLASVLGGYAPLLFAAVLIGAGVLAFVVTARISRLLGRAVAESSTAVSFEQLVGRVGAVSSASVSPTYGRVSVRDTHGTIHTVFAVIEHGEPLTERSEVALVAYDKTQHRFLVRPIERHPSSAR